MTRLKPRLSRLIGWGMHQHVTPKKWCVLKNCKYRKLGFQAIVNCCGSPWHNQHQVVPDSFVRQRLYFDQALCAVDGVHIPIVVPKSHVERFRNRKGWVSTTHLLWLIGRAHLLYLVARDLRTVHWNYDRVGFLSESSNYFVLANANYALGEKTLTPFRYVRHLSG